MLKLGRAHKNLQIFSLLICFIFGISAHAQTADIEQTAKPLERTGGIVMFDYRSLDLESGGAMDLLGAHYLHKFGDQLYFGPSISGPMLQGEYGGFFAFGLTAYTQHYVTDSWLIDGGLSLGAAAGGDSISGIRDLSGSGRYANAFFGLGYRTGSHIFGARYSYSYVQGSQINDGGISLFYQTPISFPVGKYEDAGAKIAPGNFTYSGRETIFSFELNQVHQIDPQGSFTGEIGFASTQLTHFLNDQAYVFFGLDLGYSGLMWYNQVQGGYGQRFSLADRFFTYFQLGIGSSGWVTDTIDTGAGAVLFPKARLEYRLDNGVGIFASAGYLFSLTGSSRNWSVGAGLSYSLFEKDTGSITAPNLNGVRVHAGYLHASDVLSNDVVINDLQILSIQVDYALNAHWYVPVQINAAMNRFYGYAGYAEAMAGLGWQTEYNHDNRLQWFAQALYGMNDIGVNEAVDAGPILNLSLGVNYSLSDSVALYGRIGRTFTVNQFLVEDFENYFEYNLISAGLTYRFSIPARGNS